MGLASKLAAAQQNQGGAVGYAPPPGQAPPSQQFGAPPQQYGAPPQQPPQQQYGAPQPPSGRPGSTQPAGGYAAPTGPPPGQYNAPNQPPSYGQGPPSAQYGQPQTQQPGFAPPNRPPPGQYPQQQQSPQGYPQQPGGYQQQPQGYPQQPAAGQTGDSRFLLTVLQQCVQDQNIQAFYPPGSLEPIAHKVAASGALDKIAQEWRMPKELATDLVKLSLFDVILYLDDSGSMAFEQGGERIDDLKLIMSRVAYATSLFDQDGIQVRFMNSRVEGNNIANEAAALQLLQQVKFSGLTPLGTALNQKIIQPLVLGPARNGTLQKPVLVIAITDGTPAGEDKGTIFNVIGRANDELKRTRYGPDSISYQFAQVGDDMKAQQFLGELDNHPQIGDLIDCTSNYEAEQAEMLQKSGVDLTPELWLVKLLMGGIDSSYDTKDEK